MVSGRGGNVGGGGAMRAVRFAEAFGRTGISRLLRMRRRCTSAFSERPLKNKYKF